MAKRSSSVAVSLKPTQVSAIEEIATQVLESIPGEFIRGVAREAWFKNSRPKLSGIGDSDNGEASLTSLFPGKNRFQIMRALRHANAQLAAALLADRNLDLGPNVDALLRRLTADPTGRSSIAKEIKK
jgi:hypothetical protein